ncbi:MAG: histidine kinase [Desulfosarcinaceae bacterium]
MRHRFKVVPRLTAASSHQHYIDLFDQAPFGYLVIDQRGRITAVNQAAALLNAPRQPLIGRSFSDFIHRDDRGLYQRRLDDCLSAPEGVSFEIRIKRPHGDCFDARLQMRAGKDPANGENEYRTTLVDVSDQVHLSSSHALLQECLELTRACGDLKTLLKAYVRRLKTYLRCHSVGIRFVDANGKPPYAAHAGFSWAFLSAETARDPGGDDTLLEAVLNGATVEGALQEGALQRSPKGSLYLNAAGTTLGAGRSSEPAWLRDLTVAHGYESTALIPIEVDAAAVGLLHAADRRPNRFPLRVVQTLEGVASRLGWAMDRFRLQEELMASVNALKKLSSHLLTVQEDEQQRISMELHDGCGQDLNVLKLRLKGIEKRLPPGAVDLRAECVRLLAHADKIINDVRTIAHDLKPAALDALGLVVATGQIIREFASLNDIEVETQIAALQQIKDPTTQVNLFRIFQEALNNIQKHAQATWVLISANRENHNMRISIRDNGRGFKMTLPMGTATRSKGLGFSTMELRCRMIGGRLEIDSAVESGTQLTIWLPCHPRQEGRR